MEAIIYSDFNPTAWPCVLRLFSFCRDKVEEKVLMTRIFVAPFIRRVSKSSSMKEKLTSSNGAVSVGVKRGHTLIAQIDWAGVGGGGVFNKLTGVNVNAWPRGQK